MKFGNIATLLGLMLWAILSIYLYISISTYGFDDKRSKMMTLPAASVYSALSGSKNDLQTKYYIEVQNPYTKEYETFTIPHHVFTSSKVGDKFDVNITYSDKDWKGNFPINFFGLLIALVVGVVVLANSIVTVYMRLKDKWDH